MTKKITNWDIYLEFAYYTKVCLNVCVVKPKEKCFVVNKVHWSLKSDHTVPFISFLLAPTWCRHHSQGMFFDSMLLLIKKKKKKRKRKEAKPSDLIKCSMPTEKIPWLYQWWYLINSKEIISNNWNWMIINKCLFKINIEVRLLTFTGPQAK